MSRPLTVEDVKQLILQARSDGVNAFFDGLGDNISVAGEVLVQGLQQSGIPLPADARDILNSVSSIERNADQVRLVLDSELKPTVRGTQLRLGPAVSAVIQKFPDGVALAEITGIAVNKFVWVDVQRVQYHDTGGKRSVRVDTNFGGKEFGLP
jgi:hypothetical protein